MSVKQRAFVLLGSVMLAAFVGGMVVSGRLGQTQLGTATARDAGPSAQSRPAAVALPTSPLPDLSPIAERALKSAANISSTTLTVSRDPFYRMFYGDQPQQSQSLGSGVVVSPDGYILTNTHVIGDRRADVRVTLSDNREFAAKVIGIDDISDLAVVKIDARNLDTLPWGDSAKLRIAEWVLAIGNPFQLGGTVTLGIVSTVSRPGSVVGGNSDFIQTDAAINPGNSGGALVNGRGELVGINSMIYSESGGNQGIGFAIPSKTARDIMDQLINYGTVRWGSIGQLALATIDRETARYNRLGDQAGVYVRAISPASSAARGGLRRSDLIVSMNGQPITDADQLIRLIIQTPIGSTAKLEVLRGGQRTTVNVPIVSR